MTTVIACGDSASYDWGNCWEEFGVRAVLRGTKKDWFAAVSNANSSGIGHVERM